MYDLVHHFKSQRLYWGEIRKTPRAHDLSHSLLVRVMKVQDGSLEVSASINCVS